ncbi:hypothetical protein IC575_020692 [Cucumis melo]
MIQRFLQQWELNVSVVMRLEVNALLSLLLLALISIVPLGNNINIKSNNPSALSLISSKHHYFEYKSSLINLVMTLDTIWVYERCGSASTNLQLIQSLIRKSSIIFFKKKKKKKEKRNEEKFVLSCYQLL